MSNYSRSTVVVIGASARVRRAIARHFASAGWTIGLVARLKRLNRSHAKSRAGRCAGNLCCRRRRCDQVGDMWINDATVRAFSPVWKITPDELHPVTDVTYSKSTKAAVSLSPMRA
jgi:NAD(P)-dependent dehydrogenase (short-subunit alcohol dehydrogenase family)